MNILPIQSKQKDEISDYINLDNSLIFNKIPFLCLFYGSSNSGKTTVLANIILQDLDNMFSWFLPENVYIFAQNYRTDPAMIAIIEYIEQFYPNWSKDHVQEDITLMQLDSMVQEQKQLIKSDPKKKRLRKTHQLWILDDQCTTGKMVKRYSSLSEIAQAGRHNNISTIVLAQYYTSITPSVRVMADYIFFFRWQNRKERKKLYEELGDDDDKDRLRRIYNNALTIYKKSRICLGFIVIRPALPVEDGKYWICTEYEYNPNKHDKLFPEQKSPSFISENSDSDSDTSQESV